MFFLLEEIQLDIRSSKQKLSVYTMKSPYKTNLLSIQIDKYEMKTHSKILTFIFRFYTSSLLVTYDGADKQTSLNDASTDAQSNDKIDKKTKPFDQKFTEFDDRRAKSFDEKEFDKKSFGQNLVDVRIIDFAHSTHKGLKDSTLHLGPDLGFIHGIQVA